MTVKELIEKLQTYNQELEVMLLNNEWGTFVDIESIGIEVNKPHHPKDLVLVIE